MGVLNISDRTLKKYFAFLNGLDNSSKSRLIERLKKSVTEQKNNISISDLYGKWESSLSVEEEIGEIRNSRVDRTTQWDFE